MGDRKIVIEFLGKDQSFSKTADQMAGRSNKLGATLGKLGGAFAGLAVISKATSFLKDSVAEARESQKVNAQTGAVIKSTGGAANVTAGEFGKLATAISNKTGIDDEQIQAGENMLATFTNVQNRLGKGNDIFTQATKVSTDLAVATGTDNVKANVLLGKALNDPLTGIGKLTKIGVTFTAQQKAQVKQMMKTGDVAGAQKIILKELGKEFGGSAAAQATAGEKAATAYANLKESVGTALLPVLDKFFTFVSTSLIPGLYKIPTVFSKIRAAIGPIIGGFGTLGSGSDSAGNKVSALAQTFSSAWTSIKSIFSSSVSIITSLWGAFGGTLVTYARSTLTNLMTILRGAFTVIQGIFQVFSSLLKGDWSGVWDGIKLILSGAWTMIQGIVAQGWNALKTVFALAGTALKATFSGIWTGIKSLATAGMASIVSAVKALPGKLGAIGGLFKAAGKGLITQFVNGMKNAAGIISGVAGNVWTAVKRLLNGAITKINSALNFTISLPGPDLHINAGHIPHFAKGGIVKARQGGTLGLIGEAGHDEGIFPLSGPNMPEFLKSTGGDSRPLIVQLVVDGKVLHQSLVKRKRDTGVALGLA